MPSSGLLILFGFKVSTWKPIKKIQMANGCKLGFWRKPQTDSSSKPIWYIKIEFLASLSPGIAMEINLSQEFGKWHQTN